MGLILAGKLNAGPLGSPSFQADHAETPLIAYEHIAAALGHVAKRLGKARGELKIYDPYYCDGSVVRQLGQLGFNRVHNKNEDFYAQAGHRASTALVLS